VVNFSGEFSFSASRKLDVAFGAIEVGVWGTVMSSLLSSVMSFVVGSVEGSVKGSVVGVEVSDSFFD
jgi:hypothetical protein